MPSPAFPSSIGQPVLLMEYNFVFLGMGWAFSLLRNTLPSVISSHSFDAPRTLHRLADLPDMPWFGVLIRISLSTSWPPNNARYSLATRPPIEWATILTLDEP